MNRPHDVHPVLLRPWAAVGGGIVAGIVVAAVAMVAWSLFLDGEPGDPGEPLSEPDRRVALFRLDPDAAHGMMVLPAGPDALGEPTLAERLFPDEQPRRRLASVLLTNVTAADVWEVDLASMPLRGRIAGEEWGSFTPLDAIVGAADDLSATERLRLRSLGAELVRVRVDPGTLRRVLVALPKGRKLGEFTDVQWDGRQLARDELDLERLHRFREDPAGVVR